MWEFTDKQDADLGYTYSRPAVVKLKNGKWAAVFGNGYNNTETSAEWPKPYERSARPAMPCCSSSIWKPAS